MNIKFAAVAALLGSTCAASAGGIDRSGQSITALFENGRYGELSFASVSPSTSGTSVAGLGSRNSGDLTPSYFQFGAAYKADINEQLSYALIYDQPFGADVAYPGGTGYFAQGSKAEFESHAITGLLRYKMANNVSVHGGVRVQTIEASATVPFVTGAAGPFAGAPYTVKGERETGVGYVLGAAYEKPEIALRVSLTYNSAISYDVDTTESSVLGPNRSTTEVETPQSVNLEFQTGIAADTLLFGGVRWTDYSEFKIPPASYAALTGSSLLSYADDVYTYSLGVGRKINDTWSVSASVGYEKSNGGFASNLGPTDGNKSLALAAVYTRDNMKITTGVRYVNIGDAQTAIPNFAPAANFEDNDAVAFGMKVGFTF
ncbi:Long-chain fatty acid transport protein [Sulfitobacter brevis]|uniref:Long-chain fatty acid transport protein n=1 Tax=Sulfitobacter brevis TaxID=74348 RepID=A0A1I1V5I4_9RHOB|nr:outer membrane protein transport protein [Sulfitobacter brevis]SFD75580.1 Long-chain fatty acid transport protein [Sulfitobacter brevis]